VDEAKEAKAERAAEPAPLRYTPTELAARLPE
jgi:hypothetical protein